MTRKRFYFYSLFLPLILPGLVMLATEVTHTFLDGHSPMGWLSLFALVAFTSGGLQYCAFVYFVYGWGKNKPVAQLSRAGWALPLWFWPWYTAWLVVFAALVDKAKLLAMLGPFMGIALFIIPYGYFYVLLTHFLAWAGKKAGWIVD